MNLIAISLSLILSILAVVQPPSDPYWYSAILQGCYDGDTCTLDIDLGMGIHRIGTTVRLFGINAPELRGEEREAGIRSRDWLLARIRPGDEVMIHTQKDENGKYGRLLAEIYRVCNRGWCNVNQELIDSGMAEARDY